MGGDDTSYIDSCRKGDTGVFRYIVAEYHQLVYTLVFRLLCDEDDAKMLRRRLLSRYGKILPDISSNINFRPGYIG